VCIINGSSNQATQGPYETQKGSNNTAEIVGDKNRLLQTLGRVRRLWYGTK
jgi:hypothetical protein